MVSKNKDFPFDYYLKYLFKNKITKKKFIKFSKEVFKIIEELKKNKPKEIKSKIIGNVVVPREDNGKKKNFYDLFAFHELSLFSKYITLKNNFKFALDVGANLGLHTIVLSNLGYKTKSFEADPDTFKKLRKNLKNNNCKNYEIYNFAISDFNGKSKFYQIKDNLTANTLENTSKKIYGKHEVINVKVRKIQNYLPKSNSIIKLDVEGSEYDILKTINFTKNSFKKKFFFEVNDIASAKKIFDFMKINNLKFYVEKNGWKTIKQFSNMPKSWKDGSILIDN